VKIARPQSSAAGNLLSHQLAVGSPPVHANVDTSTRIGAWVPDFVLAVSLALLLAGF
jgi:hypothetical protein